MPMEASGLAGLVLADHATGDLVSPACYRDFLLPVHREITAALGAPTILRICGNTANRLEYIASAGFDAFHFDSKVDPATALPLVDGEMTLIGNVNNPGTLLLGDPDEVRREVRSILSAGIRIVGPECALPLSTPSANLAAIPRAVEEYCQTSEE